MTSKSPGSFSQIPPKAAGPWKSSLAIDHGLNASGVIPAGSEDAESSAISPIIISPNGDLIIEYADTILAKGSVFWQVSRDMLVRNCSYFRALLDLNKFSEGVNLAQQLKYIETSTESKPALILKDSPAQVTLPVVGITANSTTSLYGADVLGLFLKILCLESMDDSVRNLFNNALKLEPPSVIARLIQVADSFNAPDVIESALRSVGYQYGKKGRSSLCSFSTALLKINEDRLRQIALISKVLKDYDVTRVMTHTLILLGSKYWHNGPHLPDREFLLWQYLPDKIEGTMITFLLPYPIKLLTLVILYRGAVLQAALYHVNNHRFTSTFPPCLWRIGGYQPPTLCTGSKINSHGVCYISQASFPM